MNESLIEYRGLWFNEKTPKAVMDVLANAYNSSTRLRIYLGDAETGKDWMEEFDVCGRIGRSTGTYKVPLLIHNTRSKFYDRIPTDCVVRIRQSSGKKLELYRHPNYSQKKLTIIPIGESSKSNQKLCGSEYTHTVLHDDKEVANFKSLQKAQRYVKHLS